MDYLILLLDTFKFDFLKFRKFFSLSSLSSFVSNKKILFILFTFILFPFIYLFILFIFIYKYTVKYLFLILDVIFFNSIFDPKIIFYYEKFIYYFKFIIFDLYFKFIPLWKKKISNQLTKKNRTKLILKALVYLDNKAFNCFVYFERKIPRWWYYSKRNYFKTKYYFLKYNSYIITVKGQRVLRRVYRSLRRRFFSFFFFMLFIGLNNLRYLFYFYYLKTLITLLFIKQKLVLSFNQFINLSIYKLFRIINLLFFIISSFISKFLFIIFGY